MKLRPQWTLLLGVAFAGLTVLGGNAADEPAKSDAEPLIVLDSAGKEVKLKTWKITAGTRHLAWLASADKDDPKEKPAKDKGGKAAPKGKPTLGPEAFELREMDSTKFAEGVLTLVPLERLRSLAYDNEKKTIAVQAATGPKDGDKVTLTGETGFKTPVNVIIIDSTIDKGEQGIAEVKYIGGEEKGIKGVKFPATKVEALPPGRPALLSTRRDSGGGMTEHKIRDFQPLFRLADGKETLSPTLYFKATLKIDMAKIIHITRTAGQQGETVWVISVKGADDETLTLLTTPLIDGKAATLAGFIGRVPAGYKLFPAQIIQEVEFDVKE
jgi:hypothetical protein